MGRGVLLNFLICDSLYDEMKSLNCTLSMSKVVEPAANLSLGGCGHSKEPAVNRIGNGKCAVVQDDTKQVDTGGIQHLLYSPRRISPRGIGLQHQDDAVCPTAKQHRTRFQP